MKPKSLFRPLFLLLILFGSFKIAAKDLPFQRNRIGEFLGQWTLDIKGGSVGWLELRQENGYLDADLMWIGGGVTPVSNVYLANDKYLIVTRTNEVVRKRDDKNNPVRRQIVTSWFEISRKGPKIEGYLISPRRSGIGTDSTWFTGTKLPPVPPAPDLKGLKFGKPVSLFNGKDLSGWRLTDAKQKNGFSVVKGELVNDPVQPEGQPHISYGNIRTDDDFEDFRLNLEVNVPEGSNSGIYLRGMYEIQVMDTYKKELDSHNMGSVYSRITPSVSAEKPAGTWQTMEITLVDRHITVVLNGITIIDNKPVQGPTGGAIQSDVFSKGPIYLQGDHGKVLYRNIVITPVIK
jgi:hypothetical protein